MNEVDLLGSYDEDQAQTQQTQQQQQGGLDDIFGLGAATQPPPPPSGREEGGGAKKSGVVGKQEYDGNGFTNVAFEDGSQGGEGEGSTTPAQGGHRKYWDLYDAPKRNGGKGGRYSDHDDGEEGGSGNGGGQGAYEYSTHVVFDGGPTGLKLESDYYGNQAIVKGFESVPGVGEGTAQKSGKVTIGDVLSAINGEDVLGLNFESKQRRLREMRMLGQPWTGSFIPLDAVSGAMQVSDNGVDEARRFIHESKLKFYTPPLPEDEMVYCSLERHRGVNVTSFELHRDDTGEFLLAASVDADLTGPFIFHTMKDSHLRHMHEIPSSADSAVYLGCMVPNFLGTEFRIMDHRVDVRNSGDVDRSEEQGLNELGMVFYSVNVLGREPNFMRVVLRRPKQGSGDGQDDEEEGRFNAGPRPQHMSIKRRVEEMKRRVGGEEEDLRLSSPVRSISCLLRRAFSDKETGRGEEEAASRAQGMVARRNQDSDDENNADEMQGGNYGVLAMEQKDDLVAFGTKKPTWNEALQAWTLNFNGRVKIPSKKNFLLAPEKGNTAMEAEFGEGKVHIRHGKMSKSRFSVDFHYPVPPLTALAVCCSTFSDKKVVT